MLSAIVGVGIKGGQFSTLRTHINTSSGFSLSFSLSLSISMGWSEQRRKNFCNSVTETTEKDDMDA